MKEKCFIIVITLMSIMLLTTACGHRKHQLSNSNADASSPISVESHLEPASVADFKKALTSIGYIETSDFELKYGCSIENVDETLINSAIKDGVTGVAEKGYLYHFANLRQYMSYQYADLTDFTESHFYPSSAIAFIVFTDESAAVTFLDGVKEEAEMHPDILVTEETENHYSKIIGQKSSSNPITFFFGEVIDTFVVAHASNTILLFEGTSSSPAYQVIDILGY